MKKLLFALLLLNGFLLFAQENKPDIKQMNSDIIQPITVTIGGDFLVTGSFSASKYQRLDHLISTIYNQARINILSGLNELETIDQISKEISQYPLRGILLKQKNGYVTKIDLLKFRLTGDFINNPYLNNDDVIIFPSYDIEKNCIDICGAVNKPTKIQYVEGDMLSDAILFAGGVNSDVYGVIKFAEISRLDSTGNVEELLKVNIEDDFKLKSNDRIRILSNENHRNNYKVLILGAVKFPGFVYVKKDSSTLIEVINKAGGFLPEADLSRSEVIRDYNSSEILKNYKLTNEYLNRSKDPLQLEAEVKLQKQKKLLEILRISNLTEEDSLYFNLDNQLRVLKSESLVDFSKLLVNDSEESNFLVRQGDLILVPNKFEYVYVFGQVAQAGYIKYKNDKNYEYYINQAGGFAETAVRDEDEIIIIKGKGMNWITENKNVHEIQPGDFVYVPKEIPRSTWFHIRRIGEITGILGTVATIILLIAQLSK